MRVRLTRVGSRKNPIWRVVVADGRSKRDGRVLETVGRYNPRRQPSEIVLDRARIEHWIARGAQPSETVRSLLRAAERGAPPERATPEGRTAGRTAASAERASSDAVPGAVAESAEGGDTPEPTAETSAEAGDTDEVPGEPAEAEEGATVADAGPADVAGEVDEEASESATAAGGG